MSFKNLEKSELVTVAETFGVDIDGRWKEDRIIEAILEEGVTFPMWEDAVSSASPDNVEINLGLDDNDETEPEKAPVATPARFKSRNAMELLKMERWNPSYSIIGYTFTTEHPFALVKPDEADWIMSHEEGFRLATPQEAEEFYAK